MGQDIQLFDDANRVLTTIRNALKNDNLISCKSSVALRDSGNGNTVNGSSGDNVNRCCVRRLM